MRTEPDKTPLVMIPGLLCDAALWQPQTDALADCADMCVADVSRCESLPDAAAQILRDVPFARFAVAGLSMGGYLALSLCALAPDRVERLALLNTRAATQDSPASAQRRQRQIDLALSGAFDEVVEQLLPSLLGPRARADEALAASVRSMSWRLGPDVFVRQQRANLARPDLGPLRELLHGARRATLIIGAEHDAIAPLPALRELHTALPDAHCEVLADCGHLSTLEQPQQVNALLRQWLSTPTG